MHEAFLETKARLGSGHQSVVRSSQAACRSCSDEEITLLGCPKNTKLVIDINSQYNHIGVTVSWCGFRRERGSLSAPTLILGIRSQWWPEPIPVQIKWLALVWETGTGVTRSDRQMYNRSILVSLPSTPD